MAKVQGPLLSMGASGQIGNSMVYAKWKGIPYARRYIVPADPNTVAQALTRSVFRAVDQAYKYLGALSRAPWSAAVKGRAMVSRNMLMRVEIPLIREEADISLWVGSPGNGGGIAPQAATAVAGVGASSIDCTLTAPNLPVGWLITRAVFSATPQRSPSALVTEVTTEAEDLVAPYTATLTVPQAATAYVVSAWLEWTREDGETVYGRSITNVATSSA